MNGRPGPVGAAGFVHPEPPPGSGEFPESPESHRAHSRYRRALEAAPAGAGGAALPYGTLLYGYYMARARFECREERVLGLLERVLPATCGNGRPLLIVAACTLARYLATSVASGVALLGLLRLAFPVGALSLLFAALLAVAVSCGLSVVGRTTSPPDEERLLMAPFSDRRAGMLAFWGADPLRMLEGLVVVPAVTGIAASVILWGRVSLVALWLAVTVVTASGCALALAAERLAGAARVRRTRRGARGASVAGYALASAIVGASGGLASRTLLRLLPETGGDPLRAGLRLLRSLPELALAKSSPLVQVVAHPASPAGAPARWVVEGAAAQLALAALWVGAAGLAAGLLVARGGGYYREEWREKRRAGRDLFDLAETCYTGLARTLYRRDPLVEVQIRNLCRCREIAAASPFYLIGGPQFWFSVGLAWGAAPILRSSEEAAAAFALLAGGWAASVTVRTPFEVFRRTLAVDAEGRRAGLYRAAGASTLELYAAKLRAGRLLGALPLCALCALLAALGELPLGAGTLLAATGLSALLVWPHLELLPGLASPHFDHEHSDEVGGQREQRELSGLAESAGVLVSLLGPALLVLLLSGRVAPEDFPWVAAPVMLVAAAGTTCVLRLLSRRASGPADGRELPP